ncbi:hypothetical protein BDN70DRAFT_765011, partial [Pholiota conissans]
PRIYARVLGYLILHGPSEKARETVSQQITTCAGDDIMLQTGEFYFNHLLRLFKRNKGPIPSPTPHPSSATFNIAKAAIMQTLDEAPTDHKTAKKAALKRDGYKCLLSGNYDFYSVEEDDKLKAIMQTEEMSPIFTECAHIFPESTNVNISDTSRRNKREYSANVWTIMHCFGFYTIPHDLNGRNIHRLENVITMCSGGHNAFDNLKLWFEPAANAGPDTYSVHTPDSSMYPRYFKRNVTFSTPDKDKYPLPSSVYLAIHAACAKVAHLSGAAEEIDILYREMEDSKVMSKDGASVEHIEHV